MRKINPRDLYVRSSFGLNPSRSLSAVTDYINNFDKKLSPLVQPEMAPLRPGVGGQCWPEFDDTEDGKYDGEFLHYAVQIDPIGIETARNRDELDEAFVTAIIAASHEMVHVDQFESKDPEMALCHLAARGNPGNYIEDGNYLHNRREIAAERGALEYAREHLRTEYPNVGIERIDELMLRYVNKPVDDPKRMYWVTLPDGEKFTKIEDVYDALDEAYDDAVNWPSKYREKIKSKDAASELFFTDTKRDKRVPGTRFDPDWEFAYDKLQASKTAEESKKMLAALTIRAKPWLVRETFEAELPDLSIKAVFGHDPDEKQAEDDKQEVSAKEDPASQEKIDKAMQAAGNVKYSGPNGPSFQP